MSQEVPLMDVSISIQKLTDGISGGFAGRAEAKH